MAAYDVVQLKNETYTTEYYNTSHPDDEITLEYVSGVSCKSKSAIVSNPINGDVAFVASSVLVLFDPRHPNQAFVENPSAREIGCVTFSDDGRFFAYGEVGHNPSVSVFNAKQFTQVNNFQVQGGKCSIKALQFHPRSIYIALLLAYDYGILVYEFVHGRKLAAAKWCVEPLAMTMTRIDCTLAVCGHRKISFFFLSDVESTKYETNAMLDKRAVLLGKHGNYTFVDIISGQNRFIKGLYTVTSCGSLCDIKSGVIKNVIKVCNRCFCVKFAFGLLFIGCENGMVNICNPENLAIVACIDDNDLFGRDRRHPINWSIKSDIVALAINQKTSIVTTLMSNQQMHSWYIRFVDDGFECSPVDASESDTDKKNPTSKMVTTHDLNCTLAQLLVQLEMTNRHQKIQKTNFLQRQPTSRFRQFNAIKITPDGKDIIVGNRSGEIKVYEATTGVLRKVIEAHNADVTFVEVMYDNDFKLVATGGRDRVIFILNAQNDYRLVQAINDHASAIVSISLAHNNGILTLVSSSKDGVILIRRAPKEETPKFITIGELPECVGSKKRTYNHSSGYIITGQEKGRINVFPFDQNVNMKPITKIQVGNAFLKSVAIDPTSSFFVAFGTEGQYVFHLQTGQQIATLCYLPGFNHLSFSQDLNYFINSNDFGCKFVWRLPSKIIDVMHANLKDRSSTMVTSREFIFNSYMSCVRVCRHLVGDDEESSTQMETTNDEGTNLNLDDFGKFSEEEKNLLTEGNNTFPMMAEEHRHMTITEKGHELMNFLCEDRHIGLVESASYTSCCTTYSRSLTDTTHAMDLRHSEGVGEIGGGGDGGGGGCCGGSSEAESDSETLKLETKSTKILPVDNVDIDDIINKMNAMNDRSETNPKASTVHTQKTGSTQTTGSSSIQSTTCQSVDLLRGMTPGHVADAEDGGETSECIKNSQKRKSSLDHVQSLDKITVSSQSHSGKGSSDRDTGSGAGITLMSQMKSDSSDQGPDCDERGRTLFQESETIITSREKNPTANQSGTMEASVRLDSKADDQTQGKESKTIDPTSHLKDSGVVEDQITDCTLVDTQLEDTTAKRSLVSSALVNDAHQSTSKAQTSHKQCTEDVNEDTHISTTMQTPGATPDDDLDSFKNNLESLRDMEDNGQLHDYYTEFCRNIHLSNYQETYVLKDSGDYDLIGNIPCCLENTSHYECSGRNDSGKGSASNTYPLTSTTMSTDHTFVPSSIETRLLGRAFPPSYSQTGQRNDGIHADYELYQHDVNLRRVFLSWLRRKLNKERRKMKQLKAQNQSQGQTREKHPSGIFQEICPSETILEEISTTTDSLSPMEHYVTTSSNVTWASNSSMCKEAIANVGNDDEARNKAPSQTASEPIALAMYDRSEVGMVQWQRYVHYGSKSSIRSRNTSYPSTLSRNSGSPEMSRHSSSLVSGSNDDANDYSNSSADSSGVVVSGNGSGRVLSRKSEKFCQPGSRSMSPREKPHHFLDGAMHPTKKVASMAEKMVETTAQKSTESFKSSPTIGNTGGMANLFRNQDDYLRKLKEVRRNFEKSIQELSNERKIQQIEAQKYFMEHK